MFLLVSIDHALAYSASLNEDFTKQIDDFLPRANMAPPNFADGNQFAKMLESAKVGAFLMAMINKTQTEIDALMVSSERPLSKIAFKNSLEKAWNDRSVIAKEARKYCSLYQLGPEINKRVFMQVWHEFWIPILLTKQDFCLPDVSLKFQKEMQATATNNGTESFTEANLTQKKDKDLDKTVLEDYINGLNAGYIKDNTWLSKFWDHEANFFWTYLQALNPNECVTGPIVADCVYVIKGKESRFLQYQIDLTSFLEDPSDREKLVEAYAETIEDLVSQYEKWVPHESNGESTPNKDKGN